MIKMISDERYWIAAILIIPVALFGYKLFRMFMPAEKNNYK
jgi:hypothetical protein